MKTGTCHIPLLRLSKSNNIIIFRTLLQSISCIIVVLQFSHSSSNLAIQKSLIFVAKSPELLIPNTPISPLILRQTLSSINVMQKMQQLSRSLSQKKSLKIISSSLSLIKISRSNSISKTSLPKIQTTPEQTAEPR